MSVIVLKDEQELRETFIKLVLLVIDMRRKQKDYEIEFDGVERRRKEMAELKVDECLNDLATKIKSGSSISLNVKDE